MVEMTYNKRCVTALLKSIGYPRNGVLDYQEPTESEVLLELARKNKIESLYLHSLNELNALKDLQEEFRTKRQYQSNFNRTCTRANAVLDNETDYAFVKSIHPFPADASDVDIAIFNVEHIGSLSSRFKNDEYEILGTAPSAMTIEDRKTGQLVDLQSFFGLHKVVYYDEQRMVENLVSHEMESDTLPIPARPYDLALIVNHSVTELMFLLKEYYATVYMLETASEEEILEFIEEIKYNRSTAGCQAFLAIVEVLSTQVFSVTPRHIDLLISELGVSSHEQKYFIKSWELPYRYSRVTLTRFTLEKFRQQKFQRSFLQQLPSFANPRTAGYILRKVYGRSSRDTY